MTEKLNNNIEQRSLGNELETTGINPEVVSPFNELSIPEIPKADQTSFNLRENSNQGEEVFSPADKGETGKGEADTSIGDEWHRIIEEKQGLSTEIPL
jgi:hypothetical protein